MKKYLRIISIFLLIALLGVLFVACDEDEPIDKEGEGAPTDFGKNETDYKEAILGTYLLKAPTEPISYEFKSNGDGTCTLVGCSVNAMSKEGENIELPSVSPGGDRVTAVDLSSVTPNGNVPRVLTKEMYDSLLATFEQNGANAFEKMKVQQHYALIDLEATLAEVEDATDKEAAKKNLLEKYPFAQAANLYVLGADYSYTDIRALSKIFDERGEYTQADCIDDYNEIIKEVAKSEKANDAILSSIPKPFIGKGEIQFITVPEGVTSIEGFGFEKLEAVSLPKSLTHIESAAFNGCMLMKEIHYLGTKAEWEALVSKPENENWDEGLAEYTVSCSDGNITK